MRLHVWVSGRVQGVHFRASMRREAQALGLRGWVRNLPDGRVEAVVEGDRHAAETLVGWCRRGPDHAVVAGVRIEEEPEEGLPGFELRRTPDA